MTGARGGPGTIPRCLALALLPGLAGAQADGGAGGEPRDRARVGLDVNVYFLEQAAGNLSGRGAWLPVYVELETASQEGQAVSLEATVARGSERIFSTMERVEVSPGAPRRAWLYLRAAPEALQAQSATFEIRGAGGETIRTGDRWGLGSSGGQRVPLNILVVGGGLATETPWPRGTPVPTEGRARVEEAIDALPARGLPDNPLGYHGVDVVLVRDLGADALEARQIDALRSWVYLGGYVILAPFSRTGAFHRSPLVGALLADRAVDPELVPCEPSDLWFVERRGPGHSGPVRFASLDAAKAPPMSLLDPVDGPCRVEIQASREELHAGLQGQRLYGEIPLGSGHVGAMALASELPSEENAELLRQLWGRVLSRAVEVGPSRSAFGDRAARFTLPSLERVLNDPSRDVGLTFIVGLIGGYLLLVGPVLYFVLKRLNRLPAVIWAEPLLVVIYLGVIFAVGYVTKGVLTKTRVYAFISQAQGDRLAVRESYLTIFSGSKARYRIDAPRGLLLGPVFKNEEEERPVRLLVAAPGGRGSGGGAQSGGAGSPGIGVPMEGLPGGGRGLSLEGHELAQWEQAHFTNLEVLDLRGEGVSVIRPSSSPPTGAEPARWKVRNNLPFPIREGIVAVSGGEHVAVSRLEPGEEIEIPEGAAAGASASGELPEWWHLLPKFREAGAASPGLRSGLLFAGVLERDGLDFELDRRSTLREKVELYILYPRR